MRLMSVVSWSLLALASLACSGGNDQGAGSGGLGGSGSSTGPNGSQLGGANSAVGSASGVAVGGNSGNVGGAVTQGGSVTGPFAVPTMTITVDNGAAIVRDSYVTASVSIDGKGSFSNYMGTAGIRGRGNSTWLWYPKKPYRIKLDTESEILGLKSNKDWVLLANYRDPTFLMNAFAFEMADWMGLPYTNHSRFVEVTLNGNDIGLYQLTEQIEQGASRVAVPDVGGLLLSLDEDDGPAVMPNATDNFSSTKFDLPVCVKYPTKQTAAQLGVIKNDFAKVEEAIAAANYDSLATLLDIPSLIDFLILQEVTYNVELVTPRSMYLHRSPGGRFVMGPVWDFDGGFDFDWTFMETSHDYFAEQELVMGTDPAQSESISPFFVGMFKNPRFVTEFKDRWATIKGTLLQHCWAVMENDAASISEALDRNATRWPIGKDHRTETARMKQWLETRVNQLETVISSYPAL